MTAEPVPVGGMFQVTVLEKVERWSGALVRVVLGHNRMRPILCIVTNLITCCKGIPAPKLAGRYASKEFAIKACFRASTCTND